MFSMPLSALAISEELSIGVASKDYGQRASILKIPHLKNQQKPYGI